MPKFRALVAPAKAGTAAVKQVLLSMLVARQALDAPRVCDWRLEIDSEWTPESIFEAVKGMSEDEFTKITLGARLPGQKTELQKVLLQAGDPCFATNTLDFW